MLDLFGFSVFRGQPLEYVLFQLLSFSLGLVPQLLLLLLLFLVVLLPLLLPGFGLLPE